LCTERPQQIRNNVMRWHCPSCYLCFSKCYYLPAEENLTCCRMYTLHRVTWHWTFDYRQNFVILFSLAKDSEMKDLENMCMYKEEKLNLVNIIIIIIIIIFLSRIRSLACIDFTTSSISWTSHISSAFGIISDFVIRPFLVNVDNLNISNIRRKYCVE